MTPKKLSQKKSEVYPRAYIGDVPYRHVPTTTTTTTTNTTEEFTYELPKKFVNGASIGRSPYVSGIDEVGRGCLAGPIISVASLFSGWDTGVPNVDDSKKISPANRKKIFQQILWSPLLVDFGIGVVSVDEINELGIDEANLLSFSRAVNALPTRPDILVVDGVKGVPGWSFEDMMVEPKADEKYPVVGAASILAKVIRDSYMEELSLKFPGYCWERNKGYGTKDHQDALRSLGATEHHRTKFISKIINEQKEIF